MSRPGRTWPCCCGGRAGRARPSRPIASMLELNPHMAGVKLQLAKVLATADDGVRDGRRPCDWPRRLAGRSATATTACSMPWRPRTRNRPIRQTPASPRSAIDLASFAQRGQWRDWKLWKLIQATGCADRGGQAVPRHVSGSRRPQPKNATESRSPEFGRHRQQTVGGHASREGIARSDDPRRIGQKRDCSRRACGL